MSGGRMQTLVKRGRPSSYSLPLFESRGSARAPASAEPPLCAIPPTMREPFENNEYVIVNNS